MKPPDRRRDDAFFADLFPTTGDRTTLAQLMDTSPSGVTQQLAPENRDKSYYHAGKLAIYAADTMDAVDGGARGEVLWSDLVESRQAWLGRQARPVKVQFPAKLAHELIEIELNTAELDGIPAARRLTLVRRLIRDLESYERGLMLDDVEDGGGESPGLGAGSEREAREATTQRPRPVEAKAS